MSGLKISIILMEVLRKIGLTDIIVSPGSRNSPLLQDFSDCGHFRIHPCIDERFAAFFALGMAMGSRRPVALCCTSGSAVLNYAPALAEAYYKCIPLIVISADREYNSIDRHQSQTIRQFGVLSNIVKKESNIASLVNANEEDLKYARVEIFSCISQSVDSPSGPVHLNIQLASPSDELKKRVDNLHVLPLDCLYPEKSYSSAFSKQITERLGKRNILVYAGACLPENNLRKILTKLSLLPGITVIVENLSNIHGGNVISGSERIFSIKDYRTTEGYVPDIIMTIGSTPLSKNGCGWIKSLPDTTEHWSIGHYNSIPDIFGKLTLQIKADPYKVFSRIYQICLRRAKTDSNHYFSDLWSGFNEKSISRLDILNNTEWSDYEAVRICMKHIPSEWRVFVSNGTSIRLIDFLPDIKCHGIYSNRGVSGIDGTTATAIGLGIGYKNPTLLISGDMSLHYDTGFLFSDNVPPDMKILVINNSGGEIFRSIKDTINLRCRESLLALPEESHLPLSELSITCGWKYFKANDMDSMREAMSGIISHKGKCIIEAITKPSNDTLVFNKLYNL